MPKYFFLFFLTCSINGFALKKREEHREDTLLYRLYKYIVYIECRKSPSSYDEDLVRCPVTCIMCHNHRSVPLRVVVALA